MSQQINTDIQLRVGAEDLACLGYQQPKPVLGELGGFAIVNESGQNKRTVLFNDTIRTAWTQLLAELTSRFPDLQIPGILQTPHFFPVSADKQHGIFLRPDGIVCDAWGVDMGGLSWNINTALSGVQRITTSVKGKKNGASSTKETPNILLISELALSDMFSANAEHKTNVICDFVDDSIWLYFPENKYASVSAFLGDYGEKYLLYQLALTEPIFIPFEQPLDSHLTLHDASDYDVWLPLAEDGTEMYEYLPDYEGCKVYHWNRTWVKAVGHQPCPLETFLHGWTERLNAAFFRNLEARITALESKLKNA